MRKILLLVGLVSLLFMGCPNELELVAINVKANKVSYTVGESVAPSDIEVVATYRDGTSKAVSGFTVTPATFSEAGTTKVTVSYSENSVAKTASYEVRVEARTYSVSFYLNNENAIGKMEPQIFTLGETQALANCEFSLDGYIFLGWAKSAAAVDKEFDDEEIILVTEDMELYAVWEKIILHSILVTPVYTGDYIVGDTLTEDDITVTATYTGGSEKKVTGWTSDADFSSVASDKEITVSYEEDGITATEKMFINIVAAYTMTYKFSTGAVELEAGTGGSAGTTATYVEFGDWPQKIKNDSVIIQERQKKEMGMFVYCAGSDGNWYCKALENACGTGAQYKYSNNEQVKRKSANSYLWFKVEPIKWRVLTSNYNGNKLLFAEKGIYASIAYYDFYDDIRTIDDKTIVPNNYKHSKIRAWLNGLSYNKSGSENSDYLNKGFLQTAFSSEEIKKIVTVDVDNSEESTNPNSNPKAFNNGANTFACEPTQDKIFLLSIKEASNSDYGFAEWDKYAHGSARIRKPTDFALANYGHLNSTPGYGGWCYLRSPYYNSSYNAWVVDSDGGNLYFNNSVRGETSVVVPALCIEP